MELDHVEAFVAVVRRGGFSRAAATLHLSQPAIRRRLRLLEAELGATLGLRYERDSHPELTCAPHHRLAHARQLRPAALAGERWITFPVRPGPGPHRQPHGAEADGGGRVRSRAAGGEQRGRGAA